MIEVLNRVIVIALAIVGVPPASKCQCVTWKQPNGLIVVLNCVVIVALAIVCVPAAVERCWESWTQVKGLIVVLKRMIVIGLCRSMRSPDRQMPNPMLDSGRIVSS